MRIIRQSAFVGVPWKNGGGITREAIRVPPGGDSFQWRVSVAEIGASGPFSDFAAYHRFMVLLKGAGVVLKFSGGVTPAAAAPAAEIRGLRSVGDMAVFDGAIATQCDLVNGPCVDLNLMVAKTMTGVQARVEVLRERRSWVCCRGESLLVFPVDAGVELECGDAAALLEPWDLALLSGPDDGAISISTRRRRGKKEVATVFLATLPTCANAPT